MDLLPAAAMRVFEHNREASKIFDVIFPRNRIHQVAQAFIVDDAGNIFFIREDDSLGAGDTQFGDEGCTKEFIICCPHKRIVDNISALKHRVFEVGAIVWHFMRDAIHENGIRRGFVHARAAKSGILCNHAFIPIADFFDKSWRPGPLTADDHTNFEHHASFIINRVRRHKGESFASTMANHVPSHPTRAGHYQCPYPTTRRRASDCFRCLGLRGRPP